MKKLSASNLINKIIFLFIMISIIISPENAYKSSLEGLNLWYNIVCPALFPFFVSLEILIKLGVINLIGIFFRPITEFLFNIPGEGAFAFIMSIASGYPVGAKVVANLRKEKICTKTECQRMISLCSTSGPLFIMGAVSVGLLKNPDIAPVLLISHYFSALTVGLLMRFYKREKNNKKSFPGVHITKLFIKNNDIEPIGKVFVESIINSVNLILMIGGYIIFFSVISGIIKQIGIIDVITSLTDLISCKSNLSDDVVSAFIIGILEVTNGVKECVLLNSPYMIKIALISFFIGFGGFSINAQVAGIIYDTDINFSLYLLIKFIQGVIASFYSILLFNLRHVSVFKTDSYQIIYKNLIRKSILKLSFSLLLLVLAFFLASVLFAALYVNINKKNKLHKRLK